MSLILEELVPQNFFRIIISGLTALFVTWQSIPVIRKTCEERNLSDSPIKRSSHKHPVPTFGGVGIFAGTLIGYMIWNFMDEGYLMHKVFACTIILFFLGIKDDIYGLSATKKIFSQILAALLIVVGSDLRISSFFGIFGVHELPYIVSVGFSIFLIVALINAFNLIDGIDGLSAGVAMIASGGFALWFMLNGYWSLACLGFSLSASLFAFLRFNFSNTSKIFMGDTGSLIVGFWVAVMALKFVEVNVLNINSDNVYQNAPVIAIALLSVPIFDTLRVFSLRILRGKSPFSADRSHLHHLMVDLGLSHVVASFILYGFTILFTSAIYFSRMYFTNTQLAISILVIFSLYILVGFLLEKERVRYVRSKASTFKEDRQKKMDSGKLVTEKGA
ncbi:glycosyltransferase family 4 protein [Leadbetterella byssophila]|jgi:UDP-GlcNAc:undecaprenyl-phosphate GlcNAc-1-phosphate transferase|uniref:Glycosyl transferase, family 4, conserved region n=1 Tax=Leadbetterella byssophila (strain DSM 17132 / JCM 16389 / KACC 11308 / NBRC 106382 / 4M15) TaxID=649349 RepID=E4RUA0_LEAB4|nr:MraY family glycosyltransferase [Leadbetterella byssophila]ADQ16934.1 Glycosyl transferase, family 4, conserved region [Leadbetterella byssophila DSM 17132]